MGQRQARRQRLDRALLAGGGVRHDQAVSGNQIRLARRVLQGPGRRRVRVALVQPGSRQAAGARHRPLPRRRRSARLLLRQHHPVRPGPAPRRFPDFQAVVWTRPASRLRHEPL